MPAWMSAPSVFFGCTPVKYAPAARGRPPPPSARPARRPLSPSPPSPSPLPAVLRPHLKRHALDNACDQRRPAILVGSGPAQNLADGRLVVVLQPASERVGHQLL